MAHTVAVGNLHMPAVGRAQAVVGKAQAVEGRGRAAVDRLVEDSRWALEVGPL